MEFHYNTDSDSPRDNLDQLPFEAIQAIKLVHECNLRIALSKRKDLSASPAKRSGNTSPGKA